jgi:hypothetical protein
MRMLSLHIIKSMVNMHFKWFSPKHIISESHRLQKLIFLPAVNRHPIGFDGVRNPEAKFSCWGPFNRREKNMCSEHTHIFKKHIINMHVYANRRKVRLIENNDKCRYLKNWHVKGLCIRCFFCRSPPRFLFGVVRQFCRFWIWSNTEC